MASFSWRRKLLIAAGAGALVATALTAPTAGAAVRHRTTIGGVSYSSISSPAPGSAAGFFGLVPVPSASGSSAAKQVGDAPTTTTTSSECKTPAGNTATASGGLNGGALPTGYNYLNPVQGGSGVTPTGYTASDVIEQTSAYYASGGYYRNTVWMCDGSQWTWDPKAKTWTENTPPMSTWGSDLSGAILLQPPANALQAIQSSAGQPGSFGGAPVGK